MTKLILEPSRWLTLALLSAAATSLHAEQWPAPIKAVEARGAEIVGRFDAPGGMQGFAAKYNGQGMALYLMPDGKHVLLGTLLDEQGADLSEAPLEQLVYQPMAKQMWARMEKSHWVGDGKDDAPRVVYVFSDPNCPYCTLFWKQSRPWVEAGKVQLRHIMVGIIREDSEAKAATILAAKSPEQALNEHESAGQSSTLAPLKTIPPHIQKQLDSNLELMNELGGQATPAIFYLDKDGRLQQQQGAPRPDALKAIMGE
ncbi:thiol:disulfide interchange protein DsbG [Pseudomonas sp. S9]|uniref:thiol:disulfide interchange protein DsbG n=1 Tax=Pseudomonas sp. S9 TaxID=686578 RepID=UPI0002557629|nr:thiol:disulfide interchange protein DsbG [Pseudomonas sp. S9]